MKRNKEMGISEEQIKRINELYHKQKAEGLTPEEAAEQKQLRLDYVAAIRADIQSSLNAVSIVNPDGSVTPLKKKETN